MEADDKHYWGYSLCNKRGNLRPNVTAEVVFGLYHEEGGCTAEMVMRWHDLGRATHSSNNSERVTPRLDAFSDSWQLFPKLPWLTFELARADEDMTPRGFIDLLKKHGFVKYHSSPGA